MKIIHSHVFGVFLSGIHKVVLNTLGTEKRRMSSTNWIETYLTDEVLEYFSSVLTFCFFKVACTYGRKCLGQKKNYVCFPLPNQPCMKPSDPNFLLTQGEKKRGKRIFDLCEFISNQIDNLV